MQDAGVDLEKLPKPSSAAVELPFDDSGFVDFAVAGTSVSGEFRCTDCWYGVIVQRELPPCPMCGGTIWERREPRFVG